MVTAERASTGAPFATALLTAQRQPCVSPGKNGAPLQLDESLVAALEKEPHRRRQGRVDRRDVGNRAAFAQLHPKARRRAAAVSELDQSYHVF